MTTDTVSAWPTKQFFVRMLVRDIELVPAIIDLVDNSVDGARRLRPDGHFDGLSVEITIGGDSFRIADNCGGIPYLIAKNYAFRFGRASGFEATPGSIGQFGVGMKRALFKLGNSFVVNSLTSDDSFTVAVDVRQWVELPDDVWDFPVTDHQPVSDVPDSVTGTTIIVRDLHEAVGRDFQSPFFRNRLVEQLRVRNARALEEGLAIILNGVPIHARIEQLLEGGGMAAAFEEHHINVGDSSVRVRLYAGIAASEPRLAGWYVYCNGRLVIGPDQTDLTGWGEGDGSVMPKYHNQYARYRGYVLFDSDDASALPWNTTKTGVDAGSELYRSVRERMLVLARPVINFLNALDRERSDVSDAPGPLGAAVEAARPTNVRAITAAREFASPKPLVVARPPASGNVTYVRPLVQIRRLQKEFGVRSYREVGERTFDHYFANELSDE